MNLINANQGFANPSQDLKLLLCTSLHIFAHLCTLASDAQSNPYVTYVCTFSLSLSQLSVFRVQHGGLPNRVDGRCLWPGDEFGHFVGKFFTVNHSLSRHPIAIHSPFTHHSIGLLFSWCHGSFVTELGQISKVTVKKVLSKSKASGIRSMAVLWPRMYRASRQALSFYEDRRWFWPYFWYGFVGKSWSGTSDMLKHADFFWTVLTNHNGQVNHKTAEDEMHRYDCPQFPESTKGFR